MGVQQYLEEAKAADSKEEKDDANDTKATEAEPSTLQAIEADPEVTQDEADAKTIAPHHQVQQYLEEAKAADSKEEKDDANDTKATEEADLNLVDVEDMNI